MSDLKAKSLAIGTLVLGGLLATSTIFPGTVLVGVSAGIVWGVVGMGSLGILLTKSKN